MIIVLSGEGPTDLGCCDGYTTICSSDSYKPGPFAIIVDKLIEGIFNYSPLECGAVHFVPRRELARIAAEVIRMPPKSLRLPGHEKNKGNNFFVRNAQALAIASKTIAQNAANEPIVAVLYRDSDNTNSTPRTEWREKFDSIVQGFEIQDFRYGIPMVAKPIGEAWMISGFMRHTSKQSLELETESSNPNSLNPIKERLDEILSFAYPLDGTGKREKMNRLVNDGHVTSDNITASSFMHFLDKIKAALLEIRSLH